MESDLVTESEESPKAEVHRDRGLNVEETQTTPDKGTSVSLKPLPSTVKVYESEPIKPGKDPGTSPTLAHDSKEEVNSSCPRVRIVKGKDPGEPLRPSQDCNEEEESNCSLAWEIGKMIRGTERLDISQWKSPRTTKLTSIDHPSGTKEFSANPHVSPKTDVTHESIPIDPGKDPGIRSEATTGTSKTRRSIDKDTKARIVNEKSGGKPLISKKQTKPRWESPKTNPHVRIFDKGKDTAFGETRLEGPLT